MSNELNDKMDLSCRQMRKRFALLDEGVTTHLQTCSRCAFEYRLFALRRATLDAAASPEPVTPDEQFFMALKARIARGPVISPSRPAEESWTAALLLTARQLVPAMAVLLLLIIGATLLWNQPLSETSQAAMRPRERVVFPDIYDYPAPTRDDVLETLVAVEEK
jgi:predicted anti-sigma-YlaC factor YlaD